MKYNTLQQPFNKCIFCGGRLRFYSSVVQRRNAFGGYSWCKKPITIKKRKMTKSHTFQYITHSKLEIQECIKCKKSMPLCNINHVSFFNSNGKLKRKLINTEY